MEQIVYLYTIMDTVAEKAGPVMEAISDAVACREFLDLMKRSPYPQDYELIRVGFIEKEQLTLSNEFCKLMNGKGESFKTKEGK